MRRPRRRPARNPCRAPPLPRRRPNHRTKVWNEGRDGIPTRRRYGAAFLVRGRMLELLAIGDWPATARLESIRLWPTIMLLQVSQCCCTVCRFSIIIALPHLAAEHLQLLRLRVIFDPFRNNLQIKAVAHGDDRLDDMFRCAVHRDPGDEGPVD